MVEGKFEINKNNKTWVNIMLIINKSLDISSR